MTTFLLELWHDLREKRLWPVAVGLLAAAVAIPLVMLKPASTAAPVPVVAAKPPAADLMPAVQVDSAPTHDSKLGTFSQRNPFKPLSDLKKADSSGNTPGTKSASSTAQPASSGSPASSSGGSSSGRSSGSSPSTGGSSTPSAPSTPSTPSVPSTPSTPATQWFRFTADISFGTPGKQKTMKGITTLKLLPDDKTASIVFMGVGDAGKSAVFFVSDPAFTPSGEGECNDKKDCRFVKLTLDAKKNEETFTSLDGTTVYKLKLLKLNREMIPASKAKGTTNLNKSSLNLGKDAVAGTISQASNAVLPRLLDLPAVAAQTK